MEVYRAGSPAKVAIEAADDNGGVVEATSAVYTVLDESGAAVTTGSVASITGGEIEVSLTSADMQLADGATRGAREIRVDFATPAGTVTNIKVFLIEGASTLEVMTNTFQTFGQATLTASEMPELRSWNLKTDYERRNALVAAFHNIAKLAFRVERPEAQNRITDRLWTPATVEDITVLTAEELAVMPAKFIKALRRAQVAEADTLLGGDVVGEHRRMGLMSHTIGEVSQMFRPGTPLILSVSHEALKHLTGYVIWSAKVARA